MHVSAGCAPIVSAEEVKFASCPVDALTVLSFFPSFSLSVFLLLFSLSPPFPRPLSVYVLLREWQLQLELSTDRDAFQEEQGVFTRRRFRERLPSPSFLQNDRMTGLCSWEVIRGEMRSSVIPECRRIALCKEARRVFPVSHSSLPPLFSLVDRNQERRRLLHQRSSSSFLHSLHSQIRDSEVKKFDDVCIGSNPFLLFSSVEDIRRETRSFSTGRRSQGEQQDRGVHSLSSQARYHSLLEQEDHHKEKKEEDGGRQGRKSQAEEDQVRKGGAEDKCRRKREGEKEE